jgi:hypothetical protein
MINKHLKEKQHLAKRAEHPELWRVGEEYSPHEL